MEDVYVESFMTPHSFFSFEIGGKLNVSSFVIERDYNPIGDKGSAYYFFNKEIDVEVSERNGLIHSFDILLRNQENVLYLGSRERRNLRLSDCSLSDFLSYLNSTEMEWKFEGITSAKSISIAYYSKLKMLFYFDCDSAQPLSLIHLSKI